MGLEPHISLEYKGDASYAVALFPGFSRRQAAVAVFQKGKTPYPVGVIHGSRRLPIPGKGVRRMLFGVPEPVKAFFRPLRARLSKPIRRALPVMVVALLLAPHRRCL